MTRISITAGATANNGRRAATQYGRRLDESAAAAEHNVSQDEWVQEVTFGFADVNGGLNITGELDELFQRIEAGGHVVKATLKILTTFVGGTSIAIGLHEPDGTVVDADGLVTAAQGATASLVLGNHIVGTGALVGAVGGTSALAHISVTTVGTFTAGEATIVVEYAKQSDNLQLMNG